MKRLACTTRKTPKSITNLVGNTACENVKGHEVWIAQFLVGSAWRVVGVLRLYVLHIFLIKPKSREDFLVSWFQINKLGSDKAWKIQAWVSIQESEARHASFLAWQAHYDLRDPAGLAGFLIDSDIKLVRAESGTPDESSWHSGSRRHEKKMGSKTNCSVFHSSSRNGMEQCRPLLSG